jgi:hypothetical protein
MDPSLGKQFPVWRLLNRKLFIEPMGYVAVGAPGNLGSVSGNANGAVSFPVYCFQIQIMTTTILIV